MVLYGIGIGIGIGITQHASGVANVQMGYYPKCNPWIPLAHHAKKSLVPAAKSIPVRLRKSARLRRTRCEP
jgi:hypothetical protein